MVWNEDIHIAEKKKEKLLCPRPNFRVAAGWFHKGIVTEEGDLLM